jgi:hypothetical protein
MALVLLHFRASSLRSAQNRPFPTVPCSDSFNRSFSGDKRCVRARPRFQNFRSSGANMAMSGRKPARIAGPYCPALTS